MVKYKRYNYSQTVLLPVSLEDQLMPSTIEFAIHTLVEHRMDVSRFDERYTNDETGCKAYDPKVLLKVVLLCYARGITTSRKIERAYRENVLFMAMSYGSNQITVPSPPLYLQWLLYCMVHNIEKIVNFGYAMG